MTEQVEKISFYGKMTSFSVKVKKEQFTTCFTVQLTEDTGVRSFPQQFKTVDLGVFDAMATNDVFDKISIPYSDYMVEYDMTFGDTNFVAKIENISASIKRPKDGGVPTTTYTVRFVKELDKDVDPKLATYVNAKELNEEGKKVDSYFSVELVAKED